MGLLTFMEKPPHGAPCNGCGLCCSEALCPLALCLFGPPEMRLCPALEPKKEGRGWDCGLVTNTSRYRKGTTKELAEASAAAAILIGAGWCCDGQLADEPKAHDWDRRKLLRLQEIADKIKPAKRAWGL